MIDFIVLPGIDEIQSTFPFCSKWPATVRNEKSSEKRSILLDFLVYMEFDRFFSVGQNDPGLSEMKKVQKNDRFCCIPWYR